MKSSMASAHFMDVRENKYLMCPSKKLPFIICGVSIEENAMFRLRFIKTRVFILMSILFLFIIFAEASQVQETLTDGVHKLEKSIENLNTRLARLLAEYSASQAKLKQRIAKLEIW